MKCWKIQPHPKEFFDFRGPEDPVDEPSASTWTTFPAPKSNTVFFLLMLSLKTASFLGHLGSKCLPTVCVEGVLGPSWAVLGPKFHLKLLLELRLRSELQLEW